jgi:cholesterol transport system auxiliary component
MKKSHMLVISTALLLAGCIGTTLPPTDTYVLRIANVKRFARSPYRTKVLKIAYPESFNERIGDAMRYVYDDKDERGDYLNSRWGNNFGQMLQGVLIEALQRSGAFKAVLPYSSTATADLRLESVIYDVAHHIRGNESEARFSVTFSLIDSYTGTLIKTRRFVYVEPTGTVDARGYAAAMNRIIKRLSDDLLVWLIENR